MTYYQTKRKAFAVVKSLHEKKIKTAHINVAIMEKFGLGKKFVKESIELIERAETE